MTAIHQTFATAADVSRDLDTTATGWDSLCYPVAVKPLGSLLSEAMQLPTDRCMAVVGEPVPGKQSILAIQSAEYSLIPNQLLREVAEAVVPGHRLSFRASLRGEFSISLIMPTEVGGVVPGGDGDVKDRIYRSILLNNSYSGKSPFSLQGSVDWEKQLVAGTQAMRVSYYREVCTNGLMGWADEYYSLDEYVAWLAAGSPTKHKKVQQQRTELVERGGETEKGRQVVLEQKFHHKGLNLELLRAHLTTAFEQCISAPNTLSADIFGQLAQVPVGKNREKLLADTKLPKMLAKVALERLALEETLLQTPANLWLAYNAANFALHNTPNSLTVSDRMLRDQAAFHHFAKLALV